MNSDEVMVMREIKSMLGKTIIPVVVLGMMALTPIHADEKSNTKNEKDKTKTEKSVAKNKSMNDVPPPAGPYRSMHGMDMSAQNHNRYEPPKWVQEQRVQMNQRPGWAEQTQQKPRQDSRQWTPPTPPQWVQQPPKWVQEQRKQMGKPQQQPKWVLEQRKQMGKPHLPPKWVQEQRKQMGKPQQPPKWVQEQRKQLSQRPDWAKQQQVPAWVKNQRQQMSKPYEVPQWVQQRREQMAKRQKEMSAYRRAPQPPQNMANGNQQRFYPAPQNWAQNRMQMPPMNQNYRRFGPPPAWDGAQYPQYRRR